MYKQTSLITFTPGASPRSRKNFRARLEEVGARQPFAYIGAGLPISLRGGDLVWHLHFPGERAWRDSGSFELLEELEAEAAVSQIDAAIYEAERFSVSEPAIENGVYRTLFVCIEASVSEKDRIRLTDELALMPKYIPEIRSWGMNATVASRGDRPWTDVWEQEFAEPDHLTGPYMTSPCHWAWVDRWFDGEMPGQAIMHDGLRHSASELAGSVIRLYRG